jgi:hypothetical protein
VARVLLIFGFAVALAGAALAQQVITVPLDPPETQSTNDEEAAAEPATPPEDEPSTAPDIATDQGNEDVTADEGETAVPEPLDRDSASRPTVADEALSDEELMDRFMQPLAPEHIYDAEVDGAENLPDPIPDAEGISRIAVIRGLDKITARVRDIEAPVGVPVMFNSLEILVQTCNKRPPEETPETTAFLQVTEHRLDGTLERIFSGWMYASSPSVNPLEHSTYDLWVIDCRTL